MGRVKVGLIGDVRLGRWNAEIDERHKTAGVTLNVARCEQEVARVAFVSWLWPTTLVPCSMIEEVQFERETSVRYLYIQLL